jgi:hypothetical protein
VRLASGRQKPASTMLTSNANRAKVENLQKYNLNISLEYSIYILKAFRKSSTTTKKLLCQKEMEKSKAMISIYS